MAGNALMVVSAGSKSVITKIIKGNVKEVLTRGLLLSGSFFLLLSIPTPGSLTFTVTTLTGSTAALATIPGSAATGSLLSLSLVLFLIFLLFLPSS